MFENGVLRKTFERKRDEVTADWKKLHNAKLHNLYSSTISLQVKKLRKQQGGWPCCTYAGQEVCMQDCGGETCGKVTMKKYMRIGS